MIEFNWEAGIQTKEGLLTDPYKIVGTLVDASVCKNKFRIDESEFPGLEKQIAGGTLRVDHSKSVRDVVGGFNFGKWNSETKKLEFEAEIDDDQVRKLAEKGRIKYISIGATADAFCSECNKPSGPLRSCKCKNAHDVIRNVKFKEGSIVLDPAYESAEWKPKDFMASLDSALASPAIEGELKVTPDSTAQAGECGKQNKKVEDIQNMSETQNTEIEGATKLKPAGPDAVILLAEKVAKLEVLLSTMKAEKKAMEDEEKKKESTIMTKLDAMLAKMEEKKKEPDEDEDDAKKPVKKAKKEDEDEDDDEAKKKECPKCGKDDDECTCKEKKKEAVRAGAKVEDAEANTQLQTDQVRYGVKVPTWIAEIVDKATKEGWFE
jgi:hypothetical protein